MPMREFHCQACNLKFETYVALTIPVSRLCPKCGKRTELIQFSLPAKRASRHGIQA
jgi:putative FmdB family regulatory protein